MSGEYVFDYQGRMYDWSRYAKANSVPPSLPKPKGLAPQKLTQSQRAAQTPKQAADYDRRVSEFATWEASERIRAQIQRDRLGKSKAKGASIGDAGGEDPNKKPTSGLNVKKGKDKSVWGVYRADGSLHTEDELDIGRQALMALVKTTNSFSRNANTLLLKAQRDNNVELERKIKDALTFLNRKGGLDISKRYEEAPQKLNARDLQTLVALMEEADDIIDQVQEFQVSTEHLNSVIQKFDLGDKLQMAERKKFLQLLGMTEKGIGNSLSGLAKNSPTELTKNTGGATTVLATMLGAALGPFGDVAAMLVNNDTVSDWLEAKGGKAIDFVKGKVTAAWGAHKGLGKKSKDSASATESVDPQSTVSGNTVPVTGTPLTGVETSDGALHVKQMGVPGPFTDAAMMAKFAQDVGDQVQKGMRELYKQLGGKAFDSEDMRLFLDTFRKEMPKEIERLVKEFPQYEEFLRSFGNDLNDTLNGDARDVLGRLDTLIESSKQGPSEAERELELNRSEKADQRRHEELIETLKEEGKAERKLLKKELDDVERKAGQGGGGGIMGTLLTALGLTGTAGIGAKLLKKLPGGARLSRMLSRVPGMGKLFGEAGEEAAAKAASKGGILRGGARFAGRLLSKIPKKGRWGLAAAGLAGMLGMSSDADASDASGQVATATGGGGGGDGGDGGSGGLPLFAGSIAADLGLQKIAPKALASGAGGLIKGTLLKAGAKRIPIFGGAVDGYMTYKDTGSIAQGIGAGVGNLVGGVGGAAVGALAGGVGAVPGEIAGSIGGSMAGQAWGKKFDEDPAEAMKGLLAYSSPIGLQLAAIRSLTKALKGTNDKVDETADNVDKNSKSVETSAKDIEKTSKATQSWLSRLARWNPFGKGGGGEAKEDTRLPAEKLQQESQASAAAKSKAQKYRDQEAAMLKKAEQATDEKTKSDYYYAAAASAHAAKAQEQADRAHQSVAAKALQEAPGLMHTGASGPVAFNSKGLSKEQAANMQMVYNAAKAQGLSDDGARALVGEIGRENAYQSKYLFGTHTDAANGQMNIGMISWQKDRALKLHQRLSDKGLLDKDGKMLHTQEAVNEQMKFFLEEGMSGSQGAKAKAATQALYGSGDSAQMADAVGRYHIKYAIDTSKYGPDGMRRSREWQSRVGSVVDTSGQAAMAAQGSGNQEWFAPMKYDVKATSGKTLALPSVLRPSGDQSQLGTASKNTVATTATRAANSQPSLQDANFMADDAMLMLVASGMV